MNIASTLFFYVSIKGPGNRAFLLAPVKAISSKALTDISFPRSRVGMPFGPLQRPTMPGHRDGQGSHAGAWEPGLVISFLEIA